MSNYLRLKKMIYISIIAAIAIVFGMIELPLVLPWLKLDPSEIIVLVAVLVVGYKGAFGVVFLRAAGRRILKLLLPAIIPTIQVEDPIMGLIGESVAIFASVIIIVSYYLISKAINTHKKPLLVAVDINHEKVTLKETILVTLAITASLTIILVTFNFLIATPLYLSYFGHIYLGALDRVYFTAFGLVSDPGLNLFVTRLAEAWHLPDVPFNGLSSLLLYNIVSYVPFNLGKGILTSLVFLVLKPRLQKFIR